MPDVCKPYSISSLEIQGFRAYLKRKVFDLSTANSLVVFAPNAYGKSSIVDALEFMFSEEGTLEQIGLIAAYNKAGPEALIHYLAVKRQIKPEIIINFKKDKIVTQSIRSALNPERKIIPQTAKEVKSNFFTDPIIRGHTLRRFVEEKKPGERYSEGLCRIC